MHGKDAEESPARGTRRRLDRWLWQPRGVLTLLVAALAVAGGLAGTALPGGPAMAGLWAGGPLLATGALAWRTSSHMDMTPADRRGWRWLAAAALAWGSVRLAAPVLVALGPSSLPALAAGAALSQALLLAGLLHFSAAEPRTRSRRLSWIDAAILTLGVGAFLSALGPAGGSSAGFDANPALWTVLAGASIVVAASLPLLRAAPPRPEARLWLLAVGIAVLAADLVAVRETAGAALAAVDPLVGLAAALLALGAHAEHVAIERLDGADEPPAPARSLPLLPTGGLMLAQAAAVHAHVAEGAGPQGLLVAVAGLVALLTLARQHLLAEVRVVAGESSARREAEDRFTALVRNSSDVILICDEGGTLRFATASAERVFGLPPAALAGRPIAELVSVEDRVRVRSIFADELRNHGASTTCELRVPRGADRVRVVEVVATNLRDEPAVAGCVLNVRDVTERRALEDQLKRLAFHDPLTLLANRALFRDRVEHALAVRKRRGQRVAVIFVDLDNFKKINDSLGHGEGDRVLRTSAQRLSKCTRTADSVARLGGDEFAVLLEDASDEEQVEEVARRIVENLKEPFTFLDSSLRVAASVGVAFAQDDDGVEELLRNADVAMYQAKSNGKSRFEVFRPEMQHAVERRLRVEAELTRAIVNGELRLFYQPIVDLKSGYLIGVEALVRWQHPERGLVSPAEFIGVAEETGQVMALGRWVLNEACREIRAWQDRMPRGRDLRVAVNVSSQQLQSGDLVEEVKAALAASGLHPGSLVLEMTESVVMQDTEATFAKLNLLKSLGVRIAIDDFGTGYSSLSYLHRFPLDILKIDRSFVTRLGEERDGTELARAIIMLGETLGLEVVAEGIELEHQLQGLVDIGCVAGQGYYWSKPAMLYEIEYSHQTRLRRRLLEDLPDSAETSATGRFQIPQFVDPGEELAATGTYRR
jgi:diguanylate cyclase (GGDEF)-like protein/PAS domain S-box-containing protein